VPRLGCAPGVACGRQSVTQSVVETPSPDGPRWLATIRDPGGNALGIVQHGPR